MFGRREKQAVALRGTTGFARVGEMRGTTLKTMNAFASIRLASTTGILAFFLGLPSARAQEFQGLGPAIPFGSSTGSIRTHVDFISDDGSVLAGTYSTDNFWDKEPSAASQAFVWTQASGAVPLGVVDPSQLPGGPGPTPYSSYATGLSADGSTVVGVACYDNGFLTTSFRWSAAGGMQSLGTADPRVGDGPKAVSQDGSIIIGQTGGGDGRYSVGFRWTQTDGFEVFPSPVPSSYYSLDSMSADGSIVAGWAATSYPLPPDFYNFLWTADSGTVRLPALGSDSHLSGDGSTVVALGVNSPLQLWTAATGPIIPNQPDGVTPLAGFAGISYDGTALAALGTVDGGQTHSFRWTISGGAQDLGFLPDGTGADAGTNAKGISADGNVIVGNSGGQAFIWSVNYGIWPLQFVLTEFYGMDQPLAGWTLTEATAISADGKTIAGNGTNPDGQPEAWVAQLPDGFN